MRIPDNKVAEIYQVADILEVVQDFVQLKRRGTNWIGLSPFKNEKTPSFVVSPSKGIFKDFSSGKGGNVVAFLMELEGFSYPEALLYLAKKYHIEVEVSEDPAYRDEESRKQSLYILNDFASRYFHTQLTQETEGKSIGLSYFTERGITRDSVEKFQLGYSPEAWDAFTQEALKNQFSKDLLIHSGLTLTNEAGDKTFDRFKGRVIFPIHTPAGKIAGFGGRILRTDAKAAKYVNSPESDIYHKSEVLYGLFFARESIRKADVVLLVEGYLDVISLHQRGVSHVVAASGTALSEFQVKTLARLTKNIVLINDADLAGISATNRAIDLLLEQGMNVGTLLLPEGEDPDSYIKQHGPEGFKEFLATNQQDFIDFRLKTAPQSMLTPAGKASLVDAIANSLSKISDLVLQQAWIQTAARKLEFPEQTIVSAVNRCLAEAGKVAARVAMREKTDSPNLSETTIPVEQAYAYNPHDSSIQEKEILRLIMNHYEATLSFVVEETLIETKLLEYIFLELSDFPFTNPLYNRVKEFVFEKVAARAEFSPNDLLNSGDQEVAALVADLFVMKDQISKNWERFDADVPAMDADVRKAVDSALHRFISYHLDRMLKEVEAKLREAITSGGSDADIHNLMVKFQRLKETDRQHNNKSGTVIKRV
jgi:DNA primase